MTEDPIIKVGLLEYDKLKAEQTQRIGFRDNLLYVTLGLFGTIVSFAASNWANYIDQLILDEITFVVSGIIALISFWVLVPGSGLAINILGGVELLLLLILGWEIIVYATLANGR
ncbi:hypothetical protein [Microcoleus sp.]|uniref:hypothetical protein n=1 Tax=Microcoleus sp. TaxID=44472 RepID=UPI003C78B678